MSLGHQAISRPHLVKLPRTGRDINIRDIKKLHSHGCFTAPTKVTSAESGLGSHQLAKGPVVGARARRAGGPLE